MQAVHNTQPHVINENPIVTMLHKIGAEIASMLLSFDRITKAITIAEHNPQARDEIYKVLMDCNHSLK